MKSHNSEPPLLILESNERRKEEVKDESIWSEVEKIRKRVKVLEMKLSNKYARET